MKKLLVIGLILSASLMGQQKTKYIDPMIGTGGHAHTFPGATVPFGMVQLSPDTDNKDWDWCSGYHYSDNSIMGFSHTHLSGTGASDLGDILFMPTTGKWQMDPGSKNNPDEGYRSRFDHKDEIAKAGYYKVFLKDYNVTAELTTTERVGIHKYSYAQTNEANVIIDLVHGISDRVTEGCVNLMDSKTVQGYRRSTGWAKDHTVYFYAVFSESFNEAKVFVDGKPVNRGDEIIKQDITGKNIKAVIQFTQLDGRSVTVKVGISHTSVEGAKANYEAEAKNKTFEQIKTEAEKKWETQLAKIDVETKNEDRKTVFYTAMYHSFLAPSLLNDVTGEYIGMDKKIYNAKKRNVYTVFSLWDTFRAVHPLYSIIEQKRTSDIIDTFLRKYNEAGILPEWELVANETYCMIGYHTIPVIVDAFVKGIKNYDINKIYEAMKKRAETEFQGIESYKKYGYISSDQESASVSRTLEYAYDDWCIAEMAKILGKKADYEYYIKKAANYKNLFDQSLNLMRPKLNGKWKEPFDPFAVTFDYTEANSWQYTFFVPQDIKGLIKLMGGRDKFYNKLNELFTMPSNLTGRHQPDISGLIGQYAHGNEPSHNFAYLFNYAGKPWETQHKVRLVMDSLYKTGVEGLCGNDDCGQMSAWYVFSSLGFYPVTPGKNYYDLGSPEFDKAVINLENGKKFTIIAHNNSAKNIYVQKIILNGKEYAKSYLSHTDINKGGKIEFFMSDKPNTTRATDEKDIADSSIPEKILRVPVITSGERSFKDYTIVTIESPDEGGVIYYTTDGSEPDQKSTKYTAPLRIESSTRFIAKAFKDGISESWPLVAEFSKNNLDCTIKLNTKYSESYTAGGDKALVDGIKGANSFRTGAWQGYEGINLDAEVDLGLVKPVTNISINFLQEWGSWIFMPKEVQFFGSVDGNKFELIGKALNTTKEDEGGSVIRKFEVNTTSKNYRFIKVIGVNRGVCPSWHPGAGGKAWIFADEISIN